MKTILKFVSVIALMLVSLAASAQMVNVTGHVVDEVSGKPIPYIAIYTASVFRPTEKFYHVSTDREGAFSLTMPSGDILYFESDPNHHPVSTIIKTNCSVDVYMPVNHRDISEYEYVGEERFGWRLVRRNGRYGFIDADGKEVVESGYDEVCDDYPGNFSMLRVRLGGRYGYVDYHGRYVYPCIYEDASLPYMVGCDLSRVKYDGKYGYVGIHNSIPCIFDNAEERLIYSYSPGTAEIDYSRGYAAVWNEGTDKIGYVTQDTYLDGPVIYEDIIWNKFSDEPLWVKINGKYAPAGTIRPKMVVKTYDHATAFNGQKLAVVGEIYRKSSGTLRYGYADKQGVLVIPMIYDAAYPFSEGYAAVVKDGKLGFIDEKGAVAVPFGDYEYFGNFSEGLAAVRKDGKIGFIDARGRNVIPFRYEGADSFTDASAIAMVKGKCGLIDKKGKALTKFIYKTVPDATDRLQFQRPDGSIVYLDAKGNEYRSLEERKNAVIKAILESDSEYVKAFVDVISGGDIDGITVVDELTSLHSLPGQQFDWFCHVLTGVWHYDEGDFVQAYEIFCETQKEFKPDPEAPFTKRTAIMKLLNDMVNAYLGEMYLLGNGVAQDYQKAVSYLEKSSWDNARYHLAYMAENGLGMDVDKQKARELYEWHFRQTGWHESWESAQSLRYWQELESPDSSQDSAASKSGDAAEETPDVVLPEMKKLALVIGNSDYTYGSFLANPVNDAEDVSFKLEELGFDVIQGIDLAAREILDKVEEFALRSSQYDVALFYYAGHGIQSGGVNYLVPVDVNLRSETDVQFDCVNVNRVLSRLNEEHCKMKIIILDACRTNPFERAWNRALGNKGLALMDAPEGTFIAFSTAPGKVAKDGSGNNSPYADALLEALNKPGQNIHDVFQEVHDIVVKNTGREQHPWTSSSLTGRLYLNDKL